MAGLWARASIILRDNAGNIAKTLVLIASALIDPGGSAVTAIQAALQALTKAVSPRASTSSEATVSGGSTGTGHYSAIEDRMILTFAAADGSTQLVEVPGPIDAAFVLGTDRVDATNTHVAALIGVIEASVSKFNQALTYVDGIRSRKKQMKR
jgi:hypothetical protein